MNLNHRKQLRQSDFHDYEYPQADVIPDGGTGDAGIVGKPGDPACIGFVGWFDEGTEINISWTHSVQGLQGADFLVPAPGMSANTLVAALVPALAGNIDTTVYADGSTVKIEPITPGTTIESPSVAIIPPLAPTGTIVTAVGTVGAPAVIDFVGTFPAGTEIGVQFTRDTLGLGGFQFFTPAEYTSQQVCDAVAEGIRQNNDITAMTAGDTTVNAEPFGDATSIEITLVSVV